MAAKMKRSGDKSSKINHENVVLREIAKVKNRKSKPSHVVNEKPSGWDMDVISHNTSLMMEEMGVSIIDEDSQDLCLGPTPPNYNNENIPPPQAPNVTRLYHSSPGSSSSPSSHDDLFCDTSLNFSHLFHVPKKRKSYTLTGEGFINKLSDEVILAIFRWIPKFMLIRCACVCKRWYRLAMDESLWKRLDLGRKALWSGQLGKVLDRGVSVLRLSSSEISTPIHTFEQVVNSVKPCQLQYLDLSMAVIQTEGLEEIFARCMHLKKVSLENCSMSDTVCRYIGANRRLLVLNLTLCQNLTTEGLSEITSNCTKLESLNLSWTNLTRDFITYLVLCLPKSLLKLNLSGARETLIDEDISKLVRTCPHLKELDLSDATLLTSDILDEIVVNLKGLEYIALSRCYQILPSSLPTLTRCVSLMAMDVFGTMREQTLKTIQDAMPHIEINKFPYSNIARPTTGVRRTSIWGLKVRDNVL